MSDLGMRRQNNQDAVATMLADRAEWEGKGHLFVVADGMGAHAAGELASKIAVDNVIHTYHKLRTPPPSALRQAVSKANEIIHTKGQSSPEFNGMGTTCSCLVLLPGVALVAHVGDSRVYRLRSGQLEQLTFDHSLVWEMAAASQSTAEEVPACIPKNVITRSLGPHASVNIDIEGPYQVQPGDVFLLCSDGLTGVVDDVLIGSLLESLPPQEAAETLVDVANLRGGPDNISVVVARLPGGENAPFSSTADSPSNQKGSASGKASIWTNLFGWLASSNNKSSTVSNLGGPYGNGPYRFYHCDAEGSAGILAGLAEELTSLELAADSPLAGRRQVDWPAFKVLCEDALKAQTAGKHRQALATYAQAIRQLMTQVRDIDNVETTAHVPPGADEPANDASVL